MLSVAPRESRLTTGAPIVASTRRCWAGADAEEPDPGAPGASVVASGPITVAASAASVGTIEKPQTSAMTASETPRR